VEVALPTEGLDGYKSLSQRAGVASEAWAEQSLYCPCCNSPKLNLTPKNTPAIDFICQSCNSLFQLKAQGRRFSHRIQDAAYSTMVRAIEENRTPNLYALHYDPSAWRVQNLTLIPNFAFPLSAIEKRNPLRPTARRAGWIGCNILLDAIPVDARIPIILDGVALPQKKVREQYTRIRPLEKLKSEQRGWTLDVLNFVRSLGKSEFDLSEVYKSEEKLSRLHPANRHVRDKIRQQLQILRDLGLLEFLGGGDYRLR
jgi:type II restriction enzyme